MVRRTMPYTVSFWVMLLILLVTTVSNAGAAAPLPDLGVGFYQGFQGGLYPGGENNLPAAYLEVGMQQALLVQPLNTEGKPDANGKIVLLSIGMSNTTQEFSVFKTMADRDGEKNPQLVIVDGAQGGQDASKMRSASSNFWSQIDLRLAKAGVSAAQVEVVWIKQAIAGESRKFPADALELQRALNEIVAILQQRFVNLRLVYLSSRTYAGYANKPLNPEPYAYEGGFAVKWLIEERINQTLMAVVAGEKATLPWLAWGPYLWTNGTNGRAFDDLIWDRSDVTGDGTHPSTSGARKVAQQLLRFFKEDETAKVWFTK